MGAQSHGLRITDLRAHVGDWVKKGQVLATFAAESVQADVLQARASLLEAQAHAADARGNAERARSIADTGAVSRQQLSQLHTAERAAQARVQAAQAVLRNQQLRQSYTRVLAPDDGVIASRSATVGAVVPAGAELFRMVRRGRLQWQAEVAAADLARVQTGAVAQLTLPTGAVLDGRVRTISPTLDARRRLAVVYVDLPDGWQHGARAGMFASGHVVAGQTQGLLVPQTAVVTRDGLDYVFVVAQHSRVQQRQVQIGVRHAQQVQILAGITPDDVLVASGGSFLNDGDTVRIVNGDVAAQSEHRPSRQTDTPDQSTE